MNRSHPSNHPGAFLLKLTKRLLACVVVASAAAGSSASEMILQNDSIPAPGGGTPLPTFIPNEIITTWLTAPMKGDVVGVQILWDSMFGANPSSQELGIHIYAGGTFPTPGATLATIPGPVLNDGILNEFRYLDPPNNSLPLQVPLNAGQMFVVGLEFLNQSSGMPQASSIEVDSACQAGLNSVYANPPYGTWGDACPLGTGGDFGIRAIFQPVPEPATLLLLMMATFCTANVRRTRSAPRYGTLA